MKEQIEAIEKKTGHSYVTKPSFAVLVCTKCAQELPLSAVYWGKSIPACNSPLVG